MLARWTVRYGPEFEESKRACRGQVSPGRLKLHLAAMELNLERDPLTYTHQFLPENGAYRVLETKDYFGDGFILTAYVVLREGLIAEVMWIDMRALPTPDDEEPEE